MYGEFSMIRDKSNICRYIVIVMFLLYTNTQIYYNLHSTFDAFLNLDWHLLIILSR